MKDVSQLAETLNLKKVQCFAVRISTGERSSGIYGYYNDFDIAMADAVGKGWFGSNGEVIKAYVYEDEMGLLYNLEYAEGKQFQDDGRNLEDEILENIKDKLTPQRTSLS